MKIKTKFKDLFLIKNKSYKDNRGSFREVIKEKSINKRFPLVLTSYSKYNVTRGLHLQTKNPQSKFVTVIKGRIFDVVVDLRKKSKTYGKYYSSILSEKNSTSIFIPAGFAHGFLGLKKENIISYHCTNYRSKKHEIGIIWNDKDVKIKWPIKNPILSKKDKNNISLKDYLKKYG